ncbi:thiamine-phosphate kinase [SAR202 cluster bacterium AD-804-J14_MRT_500m]|nr:thiamine-phosphate kinase [SAR202 cluster bacterium AD-804-J14_MRT_500m]
MKISDLGEFGVIDRLSSYIHARNTESYDLLGYELIVGVGDDTAIWKPGSGIELATTDTMVEGVHFHQYTTSWYDLGWKVMAANASDIAAMGGLPLYAMVTLGLPAETDVADVDELYKGILDFADKCQIKIVGGDMVRSSFIFITISLTGATDLSAMLRTNAQIGDQIAIIGQLGLSGAGLKLIQGSLNLENGSDRLIAAHKTPYPLIDQGRILASIGIKAAMDVSDGLVDDLGKLCIASDVSARIDSTQIPIDSSLKKFFPDEYMNMVLYGGEDYALIFCAPPPIMERALSKLSGQSTVIGEMLSGSPGQVFIIGTDGNEIKANRSGWDHYR